MIKTIVKEVLGTSLDMAGVLDRRIAQKIDGVQSWLVPMYHRIINDVKTEDPFQLGMCVHANNFESQLKYFKENFDIMPVAEVVSKKISNEDLSNNIVSITFDDGYRDNLQTALPLLEKYQIPATIFIATKILKGKSLWWDEMVILFSTSQEKSISFDHKGAIRQFANSGAGLAELLSYLWELEHDERMALVSELLDKNQVSGKSQSLYLSTEELKTLSDHPLIEIGAHTVNHQNLSKLDEDGAKQEIESSIQELENLLDKPIKSFAYPGGFYNDYTLAALDKSSIESAFATARGVNINQPSLFEIERIGMPNTSVSDFKRCLADIVNS